MTPVDCPNDRHRWITASGERRYSCGECGADAIGVIDRLRAENECLRVGCREGCGHAYYSVVLDHNRALTEAARALIEKIDLIHGDPRYVGIWQLAAIHGCRYAGPQYGDELAALRGVAIGAPASASR